jgi:hypothetical protein
VRTRLLAGGLILLVLGALLARGTGRGAAWVPFPSVAPRRVAAPPPRVPAPPATRRAPSRNLFQYADDRTAPAAPMPPLGTPRESHALADASSRVAPPPAVRVVGLIRRGGQLKAALAVQGEVTVAGKGERAGGYTVLEVDDETGVRLRGPGGDEMLLPPPPF